MIMALLMKLAADEIGFKGRSLLRHIRLKPGILALEG
jgi:hypothetical protein